MGIYPKEKYERGKATAVLKTHRVANKPVDVRRNLPANVILVHGVNDLGNSYAAVEQGLCDGLSNRLHRTFHAAKYAMPGASDKKELLPDPDAVFYRRIVEEETDSPIIPFYWGYRELDALSKNRRGQKTDRYGNRLDKDLAKGGGPFANATSTLPDMWNRGFGSLGDVSGDATRPLLDGPGRLYMVLAAQRLAALISMIRDYDEDETVTIVAHSQGCLLSLLAQAMLVEKGLRPADTLILANPPYSLADILNSEVSKLIRHFAGGEDIPMRPYYPLIKGIQSLQARLQTLINIVGHIADRKPSATDPQFATLGDNEKHDGAVGGLWKAASDRDNRGKVYLYFCPQDMTVALDSIQGIGWQGVPDLVEGTEWAMYQEKYPGRAQIPTGRTLSQQKTVTLPALSALGKGFYQRVFTNKLRLDPATGKTGVVLIGRPPPYDYPLRIKGEDDHAHVEKSDRGLRTSFPTATWPINPHDDHAVQRSGIRTVTGEALRVPVTAVLSGTNQTAAANIKQGSSHFLPKPEDRGPCEDVDPIDAEIAVTSDSGMLNWPEERPDPRVAEGQTPDSDDPDGGAASKADLEKMTQAYNAEKGLKDDDQCVIIAASYIRGKFIATVEESPNAGRLRWQHELGAVSFHGSIIGNSENHKQVTAYDVAIGKGTASTDPKFHAYLCAVADWRLKKPTFGKKTRPNIPLWADFLTQQQNYWNAELPWRKELIEGNSRYYSSGELPASLPLLTGKLWEIVIAVTVSGNRVNPPGAKP